MISDSTSARPGDQTLQALLREHDRRLNSSSPARPNPGSPAPVRYTIVRIGNWDIVQNGSGSLVANNIVTGVSRVIAVP